MKDEIKNIFQESFEDFDSPVDNKALLAGIAAKIKPKKKRKGFFWIFPAGFLLLAIVGVFFQLRTAENPALHGDVLSINNTTTKVAEINDQNGYQENNDTANLSENELQNNSVNNQRISNSAKQIVQKPKVISSKKADSNVVNDSPEQNHQRDIFSESVAHTPDLKTVDKLAREIVENKDFDIADTEINGKSENVESVIKSTLDLVSKDDANSEGGIAIIPDETVAEITEDKVTEMIADTQISREDSKPVEEVTSNESNIKPRLIDDITIKLVGGANLPSFTYGDENLGALRNETLGSGFGYSLELNGELLTRGGLSIGIGLDYDSYFNLFEWEGSYIVDGNDKYIGPVLTSDFVSSDFFFVEKERKIKRNNIRSFLDLPVSIGFRRSFGKLNVQPSLMIAFNLLQSQKGYALNEHQIPQELAAFSTTLRPKLGVALDTGYALNQRLDLVSRLSYSRRKIDDGVITEILQVPELSVGLRIGM